MSNYKQACSSSPDGDPPQKFRTQTWILLDTTRDTQAPKRDDRDLL